MAEVSLALPSVKGLGGCLSSFRRISLFISLNREQYVMKGKCKRASLSWKLLTKSRVRIRSLVSSCEKVFNGGKVREDQQKRQVVRGLKGKRLLPMNYVCWEHCDIFGESLLVFGICSGTCGLLTGLFCRSVIGSRKLVTISSKRMDFL